MCSPYHRITGSPYHALVDDDRTSTRSERPRETAREAATAIVRQLVDAGYTAYFAGGCVRDRVMGNEPEDYDVATDARPEEIVKVFPRAQGVGESFGVMLVWRSGHTIEVATFRTEGQYSDGRHPDEVHFSDAEHDATRRDFTINGLFEDPLEERIIDYVGGVQDIEHRAIRAIGDPDARLREDRLRMLRAVRFAARFAFEIDAATADAIRTGAEELQGVSRERIGQEIKRMLMDANRGVAAWEMQYLGLDRIVLREPRETVAPTRLSRLADRAAYPTALAAWLLDRHEQQHEAWRTIAERWADALMLSNVERSALNACLEAYRKLRSDWSQLGVARQKRLAASAAFNEALAIVQAIDRPLFIDIRRRVAELAETELAPEPLITGDDLIAVGLRPGPGFQRILDAVYDAQLEGGIDAKEQAVELACAIARDHGCDSGR